MKGSKIRFVPLQTTVRASPYETILDVARKSGIQISADCGGRGTCGKCKVKISPCPKLTSIESETLTSDEISQDIRLSCQHNAISDYTVEILSRQERSKILIDGRSQFDYHSDSGLDGKFGVAIDIGTTTIVCYLIDLEKNIQLDQTGFLNPQVSFGEDVMSRITFAMENDNGLYTLSHLVTNRINEEIAELLDKNKIDENDVRRVAVVGNTAMHHIFASLDIRKLGQTPYRPVKSDSIVDSATNFGLISVKEAEVYLAPLIAGFVGADTTGFILAQRLDMFDGTCIGIDIGTNGEIVLSSNGELYCCSTAAGPAFEGAAITFGMRAQNGAIEYLELDERGSPSSVSTIGDVTPEGFCGSAIVDIVAELKRIGLIDCSGRLHEGERVYKNESNISSYVILNKEEYGAKQKILFSQKDIRQVQLAKGAIRAGYQILMKEADVQLENLDAVFLAGAFGNYLRAESARGIGLIPDIKIEKVVPVGNAAGEGAKRMLVSSEQRSLADEITSKTQYVELASRPDFRDVFLESLQFN